MLVMPSMAYTRKRDSSVRTADARVDRPARAALMGPRSFRSIGLREHKQDRSSLICIKAGPLLPHLHFERREARSAVLASNEALRLSREHPFKSVDLSQSRRSPKKLICS